MSEVINYKAWNAGYMPPTEHILIHELEVEQAKCVFRSSIPGNGSINLVLVNAEIDFEVIDDMQFFITRQLARLKRRPNLSRKMVAGDLDSAKEDV